jgi:succinyl-CoA synthetase beta subunit
MKIHEYQAKSILAKYNVPCLAGRWRLPSPKPEAVAKKLGGSVVVKAQIHAGGRGKGGGVKVAKDDADEAVEIAEKILGMTLITHQTGPEGRVVQRLLSKRRCPSIKNSTSASYSTAPWARSSSWPRRRAAWRSRKWPRKRPKPSSRNSSIPAFGLQPYQARNLAFGIGIPAGRERAVAAMMALTKACLEMDASLAEINPFILTKDNKVYALDAKINFDDNALFRHKEILDLRDLNEEDPLEVEASKFGLNYIKLDGNVGCMVNGAGLAMGTMDIIKYAGGSPANFLDVGGGAMLSR